MNLLAVEREYWPTREWRTAQPESVGMNAGKLADLEKLIQSQYRNIHGIVIVRKGYIVFESYSYGDGPEDRHPVASVTKSVISALTGIAIDAGTIKSVNQKVLDFFPEYHPGPNELQKRAVTIKHLLTMTAPIALKSTSRRGNEALDRLRRQPNWVMYILDQLGRSGQLGEFQYSTAGAHLLSAIITRAAGMCAREFANEHLFRPIGMREIPKQEMKSFRLVDVFGENVTGWIEDPQGNTAGGWGLTLTPRDMARFGFLYLSGGVWENTQIVSREWIAESLLPNPNNYGYLWWLREENSNSIFMALGSGGNAIFCVPEKDLIVTITTKTAGKPRDPWVLLEKCILPGIRD